MVAGAGMVFLLARSPALTLPGLAQGLPDALVGALGVGIILALSYDAGGGLDQDHDRSTEQEEKGEG
jgi:hypothetical protein